MLREKLISDYQIFFDLRDMYPKFIELIGEMMRFAFDNQDTFHECTYLKGIFYEDDVRFIFNKLNLPLEVVSVINTILRSNQFTIVNLNINLTNEEKP